MKLIRRFLPPAVWMAAIYVFSTSLFGARETGSVLETVVRLFYPSASVGFLEAAHFIVRKTAHFMEYAVLAALWYRSLAAGRSHARWRTTWITLVICALYAATDEYHQSFVPNRTASAVDVLIDTAGAAFALTALYGIKKARSHGARLSSR